MASKKKASKRYRNDDFRSALGEHCRKLREKSGYSIDRMYREGDQLSPAAIQRLETGKADVQVSVLYRYASVLDIPIGKLFDFKIPES